jgi:hypothetical protein
MRKRVRKRVGERQGRLVMDEWGRKKRKGNE